MKKLNFFTQNLALTILFSALLFNISCTSNEKTNSNRFFNQKYSSKVKYFKQVRAEPESSKNKKYYSKLPSRHEIANMRRKDLSFQKYVEVSKYYKTDSSYQNRSKILDSQIFKITYLKKKMGPFNDNNYDNSIEIAKKDAFGISTRFDNKEYLLVGNATIQKNIDKINKSRTEDDIKNTMVLIKERSNYRRKQKISNILDGA